MLRDEAVDLFMRSYIKEDCGEKIVKSDAGTINKLVQCMLD